MRSETQTAVNNAYFLYFCMQEGHWCSVGLYNTGAAAASWSAQSRRFFLRLQSYALQEITAHSAEQFLHPSIIELLLSSYGEETSGSWSASSAVFLVCVDLPHPYLTEVHLEQGKVSDMMFYSEFLVKFVCPAHTRNG